ncbi:MAG: FAD-linked oxidase C-terminal domain-containing protein, partial [Planctomycetota bacterium]
MELVERAAAALAEKMLGVKLPHPGAGAYLLVEVEGFQGARTEEEIEAVGAALLEAGAE